MSDECLRFTKLKVVVVGDANVGKTSIINYISQQNNASVQPTVGSNNIQIVRAPEGRSVTLDMWDTAGSERYRSLMPMYLRGAKVALFVFALDQPETLKEIAETWAEFLDRTAPDAIRILVGNKADLVDDPDDAEIEECSTTIAAQTYFATSAVTGLGIDDLFDAVARGAAPVQREMALDLIQPAAVAQHPCCP
jgi:small GTP-binding protein